MGIDIDSFSLLALDHRRPPSSPTSRATRRPALIARSVSYPSSKSTPRRKTLAEAVEVFQDVLQFVRDELDGVFIERYEHTCHRDAVGRNADSRPGPARPSPRRCSLEQDQGIGVSKARALAPKCRRPCPGERHARPQLRRDHEPAGPRRGVFDCPRWLGPRETRRNPGRSPKGEGDNGHEPPFVTARGGTHPSRVSRCPARRHDRCGGSRETRSRAAGGLIAALASPELLL
jgi:hypothetical protein